MGVDIGGPFDRGRGGPGGWLILYAAELHLGPDILVPDLAGWRRERMPEMPEAPYFTMSRTGRARSSRLARARSTGGRSDESTLARG